MYKEIAANKTRTILLIGLFVIFMTAFGWLIARVFDRSFLLPLAVIVALVQAWIGYFYSDQVALLSSGAVAIPDEGEWVAVHRAVENAAITAGLPKPRVYIINDMAPNAFATGRDPTHAAVAVTRGLLQKLNKRQLEGVLAHELSHVGNYDIRVMSLVVVLVGVIVLLSDWFLRFAIYGGGRRRNDDGGLSGILALVGLVFALLSPLLATLLQLAISRKREYLADASGALLTRDPEGLASALEVIAGDQEPLEAASNATAHLFIANPLKESGHGDGRSWFAKLFDTHPPIDERIHRLRAMIDNLSSNTH